MSHATEALASWEALHVRSGRIRATPDQRRQVRAVMASYAGHFRHANSYRLKRRIAARFPWIKDINHGN